MNGAGRALRCVLVPAIALALAASAPSVAPPGRIDSPDDLRELEARIRDVAPRVRRTVVALLTVDDAGREVGSGSGTIISPDGWILTAGHVGARPGRRVKVLLEDGTELPGITVGQHFGPDGDVGLVKADAGGKSLPVAELGAAAGVATGEAVLAFGHPLGPERSPWRPPPLRVGRVIGRRDWQVAIDAPLSPGDSGGPVFSLDGALIGVNSMASERPELNMAATAESARERMQALREGLAGGEWLADPDREPAEVAAEARASDEGDDEPRVGDDGAARREHDDRRAAALAALAALNEPYADAIVTVIVDSRDACHGVFVDDEGRVLTKASELGTGARRIDVLLNDGLSVPGRRVAIDPELDLAIVETGVSDATPVSFAPAPEPALGDAVVSVGRGMSPLALGHRALGRYASGRSDAASRGLLGVSLRPASEEERAAAGSDGAVVEAVMPGSSAAAAGLEPSDVLVEIDGTPVLVPEDAGRTLGGRAPGDEVTVRWVRGGKPGSATVRLLRPPWFEQRRALSRGADLSRRATGFGEVIQHDGVVPAQNVGAPVVDSAGRVVGLNIARADRMKTYALPAARVHASVEAMLARIARGDVLPPEDPAAGAPLVAFAADGIARLLPADARVLGPTNSVSGSGGAPAIAPFADADDLAAWRLELPAPGRYEVQLDCEPAAGGKVDVFFGDDLMTVAVRARARPGLLRVGESVSLEAGAVVVRVQPLGRPTAPLMSLRGVQVQRIDLLRQAEAAWPLLRWKDFDRFRREREREERRKERQRGTLGP